MVSENKLNEICSKVEVEFNVNLPFKHRSIIIHKEMIKATIEALQKAPDQTLPQNCRQLKKEETPDGLDKELKYALDTDLRMANIISDVLAKVGIVEVVSVENKITGRMIKGTRLQREIEKKRKASRERIELDKGKIKEYIHSYDEKKYSTNVYKELVIEQLDHPKNLEIMGAWKTGCLKLDPEGSVYKDRDGNRYTFSDRWKEGTPVGYRSWVRLNKNKEALKQRIPQKISDKRPMVMLEIMQNPNIGFIYAIFILHCFYPEEYPLYDQHVYRAYKYFTTRELEIPKMASAQWNDYLLYREYFYEVKAKYRLPYWEIDRALWTFGKLLNKQVKSNIKNETKDIGRQQPAEFLLKGSISTAFRFKLKGDLKETPISSLNLEYDQPKEAQFHQNLIMIDSWMDKILGEALLCFNQEGIDQSQEIIKRLEKKNPLKYENTSVYEYKFKKFLVAMVLGMKPNKPWDGNDEIKYKNLVLPGEVQVFKHQPYNRIEFENFLLQHTKLSAVDKDHLEYGEIYEKEGNSYIDLPLQIEYTGS